MALSHFIFLLEKHPVIMASTALLIFPLDQIHRPSSHRQELASLWTLHYLYGRKMETSTLDRSIEPLIQTLQWHLQWKWKNSWAAQLIPPLPSQATQHPVQNLPDQAHTVASQIDSAIENHITFLLLQNIKVQKTWNDSCLVTYT